MMMDPKKRKALEAAGWKAGDYGDFLGLSDAERSLVELRSVAATAVKTLREQHGMSQPQAAKLIGTSQPGLVRIEKGVGVSLDLILKSYFALGGRLGALIEKRAPEHSPRQPKATHSAKISKKLRSRVVA